MTYQLQDKGFTAHLIEAIEACQSAGKRVLLLILNEKTGVGYFILYGSAHPETYG